MQRLVAWLVKRRKARSSAMARQAVQNIRDALEQNDIERLRSLACSTGLFTPDIRQRVWPLLLGLPEVAHEYTMPCKAVPQDGRRTAADEQTIRMDVARCLHRDHAGVDGRNRESVRQGLIRLLGKVVDTDTVYYYQGLHEIAATMLLQVGEACTVRMLTLLVRTHLRDCTRPDLDAVLELLQLVFVIVDTEDPTLAAHLQASGLPPFFALSWVITWFSHNVEHKLAARLFDVFLASHPLMPLYLFSMLVVKMREEILQQDSMEEIHTYLVNLDLKSCPLSVDELIAETMQLLQHRPPHVLQAIAKFRMVQACTVEAKLIQDTWWVPEQPLTPHPLLSMIPSPARIRHAVSGPRGQLQRGFLLPAVVGAGAYAMLLLMGAL